MITNNTTRAGRNVRIGGATGSQGLVAVGVGLAIVSALLIVAALLATRAGVPPIRFGVSDGAGIQPAGHGPNLPISGAGSAYDGSAYVQYLLAGPAAEPARLSGASSAYDGSAYV